MESGSEIYMTVAASVAMYEKENKEIAKEYSDKIAKVVSHFDEFLDEAVECECKNCKKDHSK
jgi:hypothetical protein